LVPKVFAAPFFRAVATRALGLSLLTPPRRLAGHARSGAVRRSSAERVPRQASGAVDVRMMFVAGVARVLLEKGRIVSHLHQWEKDFDERQRKNRLDQEAQEDATETVSKLCEECREWNDRPGTESWTACEVCRLWLARYSVRDLRRRGLLGVEG